MMITTKRLRNSVASFLLAGMLFVPQISMAASADTDSIEAEILAQQRKLDELNAKRNRQDNDKLTKQIESLQSQLQELRNRKNYDAEGAIDALASQIADLQEQMQRQNDMNDRMMEIIERLETLTEQQKNQQPVVDSGSYSSGNMLVNPAPGGGVSYTQDAKNSQGNSTMTFRYQPNHLYKIYCRTGFISDLALRKGETVNFVGGGDTSAWAINASTVDGVPHVYIKPVVDTSTTNIIITTNKRSYQLIVTVSDWYNPMVQWSYTDEDMAEFADQKRRDELNVIDTLNTGSITDLNFNYSVSGSGSKPAMVFDDGSKTIIKYNSIPQRAPAIFIRERGHREVSLVNFKIKGNCYVLDRVADKAELRFSDDDVVSISRNK